jgi:hypothetical protein
MVRILVLALSSWTFAACSYSPADPGQCKLQCNNSIIMGNDPVFSVRLKSAIPSFSCGATKAGSPIPGIRADFLTGEAILDQGGMEVAIRPVPNISVEPLVIGAVATVEGAEADSAYRGIATPRENWCSDACGVTSIQVVGLCPDAGTTSDLTIQLHSGAVYSEVAKFPIETRVPEAN